MDKKRALEKIKKCFALADSNNNANEAARALKQAHALMDRFAIESLDIQDSEIKYQRREHGFHAVPTWHKMLCYTIAQCFGCTHVYSKINDTFIGPDEKPQIAEYTLDTLSRVLDKSTNEYVAKVKAEFKKTYGRNIRPSNTLKTKNAYREAWVAGVHSVVAEFAGELSKEKVTEYRESFARQTNSDKVKEDRSKFKPRKDDILTAQAKYSGVKDGEQVKLHHGVNESDQLRLGVA